MSFIPISLVEKAISGDRLVTNLAVSSGALLVYDYLLTFQDEVELFWNTPWTKSKVLFYLTRYLVFIDFILIFWHQFGSNMSVGACKRVYEVSTFLIEIGIVIAEAALVVRTWALWGRDRMMGWLLGTLFFSCAVISIAFTAKYVQTLKFIPVKAISPNLTGCLVTIEKDHTLWVAFLSLAIFETIILVLTLGTRLKRLNQPLSLLAKMIYQDGIVYFLYLFATSTTNVVLFLDAPLLYALMLIPMQRTLHALLSSRILLNLRKFGRYTAQPQPSEGSSLRVSEHIRVHRFTEVTRDAKIEQYELQSREAKVEPIDLPILDRRTDYPFSRV